MTSRPPREVRVGQRLGLDALARVDDEQRALAGGQAARHLVGKIDVAGRVDQVQDVGLAVLGPVPQSHRVLLDRDAALALEVHRIEELVLSLAIADRPRPLEQAVRERGFPVIDVRDDAEVADERGFHGCRGAGGLAVAI